LSHQRTIAEATVVPSLIKAEERNALSSLPAVRQGFFLDFLILLCQDKRMENIQNKLAAFCSMVQAPADRKSLAVLLRQKILID
jgi:hypothetical protein